jgi:CHAT domain-containing protein
LLWLSACKPEPPPDSQYWAARAKFQQGYIDVAIELADRSLQKIEPQDPAWGWKFRVLEADMLMWRGAPEQVLTLLGPAPPSTSPVDIKARRAILQARALCRMGKFSEAEPLLSQAQALGAADHSLVAELAFARGKCSQNQSQMRVYYGQAAELAHDVDAFNEANALLYLGHFLVQEGNHEGATSVFKTALHLAESLPVLREKALGNLGYCYSEVGEIRRAIDNSAEAAKLAGDLAAKNPKEEWIQSDQAKWLLDLGREQFSQLRYADAGASYVKALSLARKLQDDDAIQTCLHDLVQLALQTSDTNKAADYTRQLEALNPRETHFLDLLLDQAELASARKDLTAAQRLLTELLVGVRQQRKVDIATRWRAESDLAVVYEAEEKFDLAEIMFKQAIATAVEARRNCGSVECKISFQDRDPFFDSYVKFLVSRHRALAALDVAEFGRSPTLSEGLDQAKRTSLQGIRLERIQNSLKTQHGVVLAYWLGWEASYLWAITPSQVRLFRLPPEPEIERDAEAYTRAIVDRDEAAESRRGAMLYDILVRPAAALIPPETKVIIVPHRKLYNLNFETIVVPAPKPHYWIEDVRLEYASFLGALAGHAPKASSGPGKRMLLIGAPALADKQFPQLRFANEEIKKVSMHFPSGEDRVITGNQATPQAYLDGNPGQYHLLHFVTHGTSSTVAESPLDAAIILSPASNIASSGDPEGSYRLNGKEIMKTPLHADLVTVSACYGLGREYSGEGLVGLAWAFLRAGAHQVIAALWEVDDASSPQLMDDFYAELTQGKSAAEALRDAKLKMLHSSDFHRHPYYWASLQLYTGS